MTAQTILPANTLSSGYDVANSVRLAGDAYGQKSISSSGSGTTATFSAWIKPSVTPDKALFTSYIDSNNYVEIYFSSGQFRVFHYDGGSTSNDVKTNAYYRDVTAWYHFHVIFDTTNGTEADRIQIYVNGTRVTSLATSNYPSSSQDLELSSSAATFNLAARNGDEQFIGYMAEVVWLDGTASAVTNFGEFDEDSSTIWKPKSVSGLTFGTNGFYLDFEDSSNLGNDVNGGTDFTETNLAATDQTTDTCTNNFATMNSLDNYYASTTFSEGNLKMVTNGSAIVYNTSTIGFDTGKWYMEVKLGSSSGEVLGVITGPATANNNDNKIGNRADGWGYDYRGLVENAGVDEGGTFAAFDSGDVIGVYADLDNDKIYFSKNGTLQNSGTGLNLDVAGSPTYFFAVGDNHGSNAATFEVNFGNPVSALSSAVSDGEYGNFEYSTTITGDGASKTFKALNTKNLAEFG